MLVPKKQEDIGLTVYCAFTIKYSHYAHKEFANRLNLPTFFLYKTCYIAMKHGEISKSLIIINCFAHKIKSICIGIPAFMFLMFFFHLLTKQCILISTLSLVWHFAKV